MDFGKNMKFLWKSSVKPAQHAVSAHKSRHYKKKKFNTSSGHKKYWQTSPKLVNQTSTRLTDIRTYSNTSQFFCRWFEKLVIPNTVAKVFKIDVNTCTVLQQWYVITHERWGQIFDVCTKQSSISIPSSETFNSDTKEINQIFDQNARQLTLLNAKHHSWYFASLPGRKQHTTIGQETEHRLTTHATPKIKTLMLGVWNRCTVNLLFETHCKKRKLCTAKHWKDRLCWKACTCNWPNKHSFLPDMWEPDLR